MDVVEEIKARLNVDEVVGSYIQLKPAGRNLKGVCPFHHEKTPSFMVSPEKGIWHCFGCSEGGDIFEFVQKMDGLDFRAALELLAGKAGIAPERLAPKNPAQTQHKARLKDVLELATKYFQTAFVKSKSAQEYAIKQRQLNRETVESFQIGYAPTSRSGLVELLTKRGFSEKEIIDSGLGRKGQAGLQDLFWGRLMLPLTDKNGAVVGFTGRILDEKAKAPKYINTPATLLYDKSRLIFGWHQAKDAIREASLAIVVEGNMDVLASHQAQVKNVVALSGTALTTYQLKDIGRLARQVVIAFDSDSAGVKAAERAIELAQGTTIELRIANLDAKDPDDLIAQDPKLWQQAIEKAPPALEWLLKTLTAEFDTGSASGKKALTDRYLKTLARLSDAVEQEHYVKLAADTLAVSETALVQKLGSYDGAKSTAPKAAAYQTQPDSKSEGTVSEEALLALATAYPDVRSALADLEPEHFARPERQQLFKYLKANPKSSLDTELPTQLREIENYVKILQVKAETSYSDWAPTDRRIEGFSLAQRLEEIRIKKAKQTLTEKIKAAEAAGDAALAQKLLQEYQLLVKS